MKYVTSWKLLRDKKMCCHLETTETKRITKVYIEVFLVKDKSKRDICLMLKKTSCVTAYDSVHGNTHKK